MTLRTLSRALSAGTVLAVLLAPGCGGDNNNNNVPPPSTTIRTLNAFIPPAGSNGTVTVTANGTVLTGANGVNFGQFTPNTAPCMTVTSGSFSPVATATGVNGNILPNTPINLAGNAGETLIVTGANGTVGATAPQVIAVPSFSTNVNGAIPSGDVAIRFINLSPGSGPVSIFNTANGTTSTLNNGTNAIDFGFNSNTNSYIFVPANQLGTLSLRQSSNPNVDLGILGGNINGTNLQAGNAYTVYLVGQQNNVSQPLATAISQDQPFSCNPAF